MKDRYESPLCSRYASREMQRIFSPDYKLSTWRKLWVALAESEMELGLPITQAQVDEMKAHIYDINYEDAQQHEARVRHDVMAHVMAYGDYARACVPFPSSCSCRTPLRPPLPLSPVLPPVPPLPLSPVLPPVPPRPPPPLSPTLTGASGHGSPASSSARQLRSCARASASARSFSSSWDSSRSMLARAASTRPRIVLCWLLAESRSRTSSRPKPILRSEVTTCRWSRTAGS